MHVVTLAGGTNFGYLLKEFPKIKDYIEVIAGMFGAVIGGNTTPVNFIIFIK